MSSSSYNSNHYQKINYRDNVPFFLSLTFSIMCLDRINLALHRDIRNSALDMETPLLIA